MPTLEPEVGEAPHKLHSRQWGRLGSPKGRIVCVHRRRKARQKETIHVSYSEPELKEFNL